MVARGQGRRESLGKGVQAAPVETLASPRAQRYTMESDSDLEAQRDVSVSQMLALLEELRSLPKSEVLGRLKAFGWLRQLLIEHESFLKDAFREQNGFQTVISSIAAGGGALSAPSISEDAMDQSEGPVPEELENARSGIAVLSQALTDHRPNQRYFEGTIGGSDALLEALLASGTFSSTERGQRSPAVLDLLCGMLFAFALNDDSVSGLFAGARKALVSSSSASRGASKLGERQEELLKSRVEQCGLRSCSILTPSVFANLTKLVLSTHDEVFSGTYFYAVTALLEGSVRNLVQVRSVGLLRLLLDALLSSEERWSQGLNRSILHLIYLLSKHGLDDQCLRTLMVALYGQMQSPEQEHVLLDLLHVASPPAQFPSFHFAMGQAGAGHIYCTDLPQESGQLMTSYSLSLWLRIDRFTRQCRIPLYTFADQETDEQLCHVYLAEEGRSIEIRVGTNDPVVFDQAVIEPNRLYHFAVVQTKNRLTPSQAMLYLDGELVQQHSCRYPSFDRRNPLAFYLGADPLSGSSSGQSLEQSPEWCVGATLLMDGALGDDLIYVVQTLGPRYIGNLQDSLGSLQTYASSSALNVKVEQKIQLGAQNKQANIAQSELVLAIRGKAGQFFPEQKMLLHLIPGNTIDPYARSYPYSLEVNKWAPASLARGLYHEPFVINSAFPRLSDALSQRYGLASLRGPCTYLAVSTLSSGLWKAGGPGVLLALIGQSNSSQRLLQTLRLLIDVLASDWRLSEDMERLRGYEMLANLLKSKKPLLTTQIQSTIFRLCGLDLNSPHTALVTNPLAFRVFLLDFDIWHLRDTSPFADELAQNHLSLFKIYLEISVNAQFNRKRLSRLQIAKKMLSAVRMKKIQPHLQDAFCGAFGVVLQYNFAADAVRTTATLIASAICPPVESGLSNGFSSVHGPITIGEGVAIMRVLTSLLLEKQPVVDPAMGTRPQGGPLSHACDKFAELVTNRWTLLFLQYPNNLEATQMALAILVRLLITQNEKYLNKFRSGCDGFVVLETRLPTFLQHSNLLLPYLFMLLCGRDPARFKSEGVQLNERFLRTLLAKRSRLQVTCKDVVPLIYSAIRCSASAFPEAHHALCAFTALVLDCSPEFAIATSESKILEQTFCLSVLPHDTDVQLRPLLEDAYSIHEVISQSHGSVNDSTPLDMLLAQSFVSQGNGSSDKTEPDSNLALAKLIGAALAIAFMARRTSHRSIAPAIVLLGRGSLLQCQDIHFVRYTLSQYVSSLHGGIRNQLDILADNTFRQALISEIKCLADFARVGWIIDTSRLHLVDLIMTILSTSLQLTNLGQMSSDTRFIRSLYNALKRLLPIGMFGSSNCPTVITYLTQEHLSIFQLEVPEIESLVRDIEMLASLDADLTGDIKVMQALRQAILQDSDKYPTERVGVDLSDTRSTANEIIRASAIDAARLFKDQIALIVAGGRRINEIRDNQRGRLTKFVSRTERWIQTIRKVELARLVRSKQDAADLLEFIDQEFVELLRDLTYPGALFHGATPAIKEMWRLDLTEGPARMRKKMKREQGKKSLEAILSSLNAESHGANLSRGSPKTGSGNESTLTDFESISIVDDTGTALEEENREDAEEDRLRKILRRLDPGDKIVHAYNMSRIVGIEMVAGLVLLGNTGIYMIDNYFIRTDGEIVDISDAPDSERDVYTMSILAQGPSGDVETSAHRTRKWKHTSLQELRTRRYLFRDVAIELFFHDGQSFLLVLTARDRDDLYAKLIAKSSSALGDEHATAAPRLILRSGITETSLGSNITHRLASAFSLSSEMVATKQWQKGELSNFAYLMHLNQLAGRTYNDLTQYPVFPWVLADYQSEKLDLANPASYRDLRKPMGAQGERRAAEYIERFEESREMTQGGTPFFYGTHYSSAMIVCSYLIRLEPFTRQYVKLQGGLDHADRLFSSIAKAWTSASAENRGDVRELIPEFFYNPEFLVNSNGYNLGRKQDGDEEINEVKLPAWAEQDPLLFVNIHRQALESEYVSTNLQHWIDLIFGYKQQGEAAEQCMNVFHPLSYSGAINLDTVQDNVERNAMVGIIHNFGQTPKRLFHKPHPAKFAHNASTYNIPEDLRKLTQLIRPLKTLSGSVAYIDPDPSDPTAPKAWQQSCLGFKVTRDLRFEWGFLDGSLRLFESSGRCSVYESTHCGLVTHIAIADETTLLTVGSDAVITIWRMSWENNRLALDASARLRGHHDDILCMTTSRTYSLVLTGAMDHCCIIWDLNSMRLVERLKHLQPVQQVAVNQVTGDLATCAGTLVSIWTVNGKLLASIETSQMSEPIASICFYESSDRDWLPHCVFFTGHDKGEIQIWQLTGPENVERQRQIVRLTKLRHTDRLNPGSDQDELASLRITALAQYGRTLYHGDDQGRVYIWNFPDGVFRFPETATTTCMLCRRSFALLGDPRRHCQACAAIHCTQCSVFTDQIGRHCRDCRARLFGTPTVTNKLC